MGTPTLETHLPWEWKRCIVCLSEPTPDNPMSSEHIIPEALGGILTVDFLCKRCNDFFGSNVDYTACSDLAIRQAAFTLPNVPAERYKEINRRLNQRQKFVLHTTEGNQVDGLAKNGTIQPIPTISKEGNLVQPKKLIDHAVKKRLAKDGKTAKEIADAIGKHGSIPPEQICELTADLDLKTWSVVKVEFKPGETASPILFLKIAFEYLALHLGRTVYADEPALTEIRDTLLTLNKKNAFVEYFQRENKWAVHGMVFHGNNPYAQVQIRLFGSLAYRVNFPHLAVGGPRIAYTLDLAQNKHEGILLDAQKDD